MESNGSEKLLTVAQVAERLSLAENTIRHWLSDGRLPTVRLGDTDKAPVRIPEAALEEWLDDRDGWAKRRADASRARLVVPSCPCTGGDAALCARGSSLNRRRRSSG